MHAQVPSLFCERFALCPDALDLILGPQQPHHDQPSPSSAGAAPAVPPSTPHSPRSPSPCHDARRLAWRIWAEHFGALDLQDQVVVALCDQLMAMQQAGQGAREADAAECHRAVVQRFSTVPRAEATLKRVRWRGRRGAAGAVRSNSTRHPSACSRVLAVCCVTFRRRAVGGAARRQPPHGHIPRLLERVRPRGAPVGRRGLWCRHRE